MAKPSPQKSPKRGRERPPRRQSPRKQQTTPASKVHHDSEAESEHNLGAEETVALAVKLNYTDEFIGSLTDMIEYYAERILIAKGDDRVGLYKTFNNYWKMHPMAKHEFGRLYARNLLTNCIVATCTRSPYPNLADDGGAEDKIKPMISLSRDNWKQIKTEFMVLRNLAVRKDTKTTFDFLLDNASVQKLSDPGDVDEKLDCAKFFKGSHDRLRKRFEIQEAVAPIRERLEIAVANKTEPSVIQDDIDDILDFLEDTTYEGVDEVVLSLFEGESLGNRPQLKPWTQLKDVLQTKYFSLTYLQAMAEKLLQDWNREIFGEPPILVKMKYRLADGESISDSSVNIDRPTSEPTLQSLKRKREILGKYHGEDPLEESLRIGARARGTRVCDERVRDENTRDDVGEHTRDDKKEGAEGGEVEEAEIAEDDEQEEVGPLELSGLPPRKKMYVKVYRGAEPDQDVFTSDGRVKKRRPWTEREIGALKKGVAKYGKGSWAEIKNEYAEILRNRTTVQLKDKWRNMERKGEDKEE